MATPVVLVATSRLPASAPIALKKAYIVIVNMKRNSKLMKNCDGVRERFDIK